MDNKIIAKLNMVHQKDAIYLADPTRTIEFIGDDIKYITKDDTVTYINIQYSNTSIKQAIYDMLTIKYDYIKIYDGINEVFIQREIYHNTKIYNIYGIGIINNPVDADILCFRLTKDFDYTD